MIDGKFLADTDPYFCDATGAYSTNRGSGPLKMGTYHTSRKADGARDHGGTHTLSRCSLSDRPRPASRADDHPLRIQYSAQVKLATALALDSRIADSERHHSRGLVYISPPISTSHDAWFSSHEEHHSSDHTTP